MQGLKDLLLFLLFFEKSDEFKPGNYKITEDGKLIYLDDAASNDILKSWEVSKVKHVGYKSKIFFILTRFMSFLKKIKWYMVPKQTNGNYVAIMKTNDSYIFFSEEKNDSTVCKKYFNLDDFNNELYLYKKFYFLFPLPESYFDDNNQTIEMRWLKNYISKDIRPIIRVLNDFLKKTECFYSDEELLEFLSIYDKFFGIENQLSEILLSMPQVEVHGDFWRANIMLDGDEIKIIDFEHSHKSIFFYDFFYYIYSEAKQNNNFWYLDNYFLGEYDIYLEEMFNTVSCDYKSSRKMLYFKIFVVFYLKHYESRGNDITLEFDNINKFVRRIKLFSHSAE